MCLAVRFEHPRATIGRTWVTPSGQRRKLSSECQSQGIRIGQVSKPTESDRTGHDENRKPSLTPWPPSTCLVNLVLGRSAPQLREVIKKSITIVRRRFILALSLNGAAAASASPPVPLARRTCRPLVYLARQAAPIGPPLIELFQPLLTLFEVALFHNPKRKRGEIDVDFGPRSRFGLGLAENDHASATSKLTLRVRIISETPL